MPRSTTKKTPKAKRTTKSREVKRFSKVKRAIPTQTINSLALISTATTLPGTAQATLAKASTFVAQAQLVKVSDGSSAGQAAQMLVQLKQYKETVEEARTFAVKPLQEHVKRLNSLFKPTLDRLEEADQTIRRKVYDYRTAVELKAAEERTKLLAKAEEAQEQGDQESALELATQAVDVETAQKNTHVEGGTVNVAKMTDFEIEDLAKVPQEYFTVDEKKIRAAIKAGMTSIPGVRIFERDQLRVSAS